MILPQGGGIYTQCGKKTPLPAPRRHSGRFLPGPFYAAQPADVRSAQVKPGYAGRDGTEQLLLDGVRRRRVLFHGQRSAEQAGKAGKVLVERGEAAVEQMGKYSEELQRKCQEDAQRRRDERMDGRLSAMSAQEREALRRRLDQLDELDRQAAECAEADARSAEITEIHGGPQERSDNDGE